MAVLVRGPSSALHPVTQPGVLGVIQHFSFPSPNQLCPCQYHIRVSSSHLNHYSSFLAGVSDLGSPFLLVPYPVTRIIFMKFKSDVTAPWSKISLWFPVINLSHIGLPYPHLCGIPFLTPVSVIYFQAWCSPDILCRLLPQTFTAIILNTWNILCPAQSPESLCMLQGQLLLFFLN